MLGARSPFSSPWGFGITGSPSAGWTFTKTAGGAEVLSKWNVSDDAVAKLQIENGTGTAAAFVPAIAGYGSGNLRALEIYGFTTGDTGSSAAVRFNAQTAAGAALTTRNPWEFYNYTNLVLSVLPLNSGANSALSWGTQAGAAPAFTTRPAGTRVILYSAISGTKVDNAIGVRENGIANTYTVQEATSAYSHIFYGGITPAMTLRGDGLLTSTGGRVEKVRVALTTPVTLSASTDHNVIAKLTTPGAVAVTLPAGTAGQRFIVQDGTGDAAANNITITPAAGTINGAATLVIAANYGRADLVYDGATWLSA